MHINITFRLNNYLGGLIFGRGIITSRYFSNSRAFDFLSEMKIFTEEVESWQLKKMTLDYLLVS